MNRPRNQSLAGAVLAGDQDCGIRGAHPGHNLQDLSHGGRASNQLRHGLRLLSALCGFKLARVSPGPRQFKLVVNNIEQALVVPGLFDEVLGPVPHGINGEFHATPSGHDHDRQDVIHSPNLLEEIKALSAGRGIS